LAEVEHQALREAEVEVVSRPVVAEDSSQQEDRVMIVVRGSCTQ
jgi:hypothetical protein